MINLNEYIKSNPEYKIVKCPCCGKDTLDFYFICEGCGWEYDGTTDPDSYSVANNSTINQWRA